MHKSLTNTKENIQEFTLESFKDLSHDNSNVESFYKGIQCLHSNYLLDSKNHFLDALNGTEETEIEYFEYLSFLGLSEVLINKSIGGLNRCYEATKGFSNAPNLYLNIAYAEYYLKNRRRSVMAIENILKFDSNYIYADFFNKCMKQRNKQRNNRAKNIVGQLFRKKDNCIDNEFDHIFKNYIKSKLTSSPT